MSGFILQRLTRSLIPVNALNVDAYKDTSYFEAWEVIDGKIIKEDAGALCDDIYSIGSVCFQFDDFKRSIDTEGSFIFKSDVYWIPNGELYSIIRKWSRSEVKQAAGLRASYKQIEIGKEYRHFVRDDFVHSWNLKNEEQIYQNAKNLLFRYCPNDTNRDYELLLANTYDILAEKYRYLADKIIEEWKQEHGFVSE